MTLAELRQLQKTLAAPRDYWKATQKWNVISAVRGPDGPSYNEDYEKAIQKTQIKLRTTGVIRRVAAPYLAEGVGVDVASSGLRFGVKPGDVSIVGAHFLRHTLEAASALGLIEMYPAGLDDATEVVGLSADELMKKLLSKDRKEKRHAKKTNRTTK